MHGNLLKNTDMEADFFERGALCHEIESGPKTGKKRTAGGILKKKYK